MYAYKAKVKTGAQTFLFGGRAVNKRAQSHNGQAMLVMRLDEFGERVRFGVIKADDAGTAEDLGILEPGQLYVIDLRKITGVYAICDATQDTTIDCTVMAQKD